MKLSDYVWDRIAGEGVEHVFMLPGGGCMHLVDSLGRHPSLKFICNLHEQGTAIAVDAYAQYRGFGAGLVTTGPGGTNALTGVAGAWMDSTPCIFISGQVKSADLRTRHHEVRQFGFQEADIVAMARPITKYAVTVEDPTTIRLHLDRALFEARNGRPGPVWVDLPLDVQAAQIEVDELPGWQAPEPSMPDLNGPARRALNALRSSRRPVLLLGNGVRHAQAIPAALRLAERLHLPVLTTWKAADFLPESHPLFAGRPGASGQRAANFAQQNSDWLLSIGARLDLGQIAYMPRLFAPGARKFVVDIDARELEKLDMTLEEAIQADAGDFLGALHQELDREAPERSFGNWHTRIAEWRARYPVLQPDYRRSEQPVNAYAFIEALAACLGSEDVLAPGSSGQCSELTCQAFPIPAGLRMLNSQGLGAMGFGIPGALGACVASGGKRTICIDGDGGFPMNVQELEVIRRLDLPIKLFVFDNGGYGSIRNSQRTHFAGHLVASDANSGLTLPDVLELARAFHIPTARLDTQVDLPSRLADLLATPGPLICAVTLDPDQPTLPRVTSYQKPDGSMASRPMEDMFPLLDREELATIMNPSNP